MDSITKRAKVDQETEKKANKQSNTVEKSATSLEQHTVPTSLETVASTSDVSSIAKTEAKEEKSSYDQLPKEMNEMKIRDEKANNHDEKVTFVVNSFHVIFPSDMCIYYHSAIF